MRAAKSSFRGRAKPMAWVFLLLGTTATKTTTTAMSLDIAVVSRRRFVAAAAAAAAAAATGSMAIAEVPGESLPPASAATGSAQSIRIEPKSNANANANAFSFANDNAVNTPEGQRPQLLLSIIPAMPLGAPATNATIPSEVVRTIEREVSILEGTGSTGSPNQNPDPNTINNAVSEKLSGSWRLLYSNAPEIVGLSRGLPLGFRLGPVFQPLDTDLGVFENDARLEHPLGLAVLRTIVVGRVNPGSEGSFNTVGVENTSNNRVDIEFERIVFSIETLLGRPLEPPIRRTLVPNTKTTAATTTTGTTGTTTTTTTTGTTKSLPANDQTYLDDALRIVRGGEGSLFVFSREGGSASRSGSRSGSRATTLASERDALLDDAAATKNRPHQEGDRKRRKNGPPWWSWVESTTPLGDELLLESPGGQQQQADVDKIPAEIEFLFRDRGRNQR